MGKVLDILVSGCSLSYTCLTMRCCRCIGTIIRNELFPLVKCNLDSIRRTHVARSVHPFSRAGRGCGNLDRVARVGTFHKFETRNGHKSWRCTSWNGSQQHTSEPSYKREIIELWSLTTDYICVSRIIYTHPRYKDLPQVIPLADCLLVRGRPCIWPVYHCRVVGDHDDWL